MKYPVLEVGNSPVVPRVSSGSPGMGGQRSQLQDGVEDLRLAALRRLDL